MATSNAGVGRRRDVDGVVSSVGYVVFIAALLAGCDSREVQPASTFAALSREHAGSGAADGGVYDGAVELSDAMLHEPDAMVHDHDAMPTDPDDDAGTEPDAATPPDAVDEHCSMVMPADPRDEFIASSEPVVWRSNRARDVLLPQIVIDWMDELELQEAHNAWHTTRRWDDICGESFARFEDCDFAQSLVAEGLWRAEYQQGAPGAGVAFLHMHRHMIQMFKSAFPKHADLFAGWSHVPRSRVDPANPPPWRTITWSRDNLTGFDILENIEDHIDEFPNDDELGLYIESTFRWTPETPFVGDDRPGAGVHGALHGQWAISRSPANLGRTDTALPNFVFWKLHGFIDDVWSRYRAAKGLRDDDADYRAVAHAECRLMHFLAPVNRPEPAPPTDGSLKRH